jgi:cell division inhibitor SepF
MAKAFKKMANYLGLVDDEELEESLVEVAVQEPRRGFRALSHSRHEDSTELPSYMRPANPAAAGVTPVHTSISRPASMTAPVSATPIAAPMDRIVTIQPRIYADVRAVGEQYRNGQPVIMNLSDVDENECKRFVDFASGLVFGHYGKIERVTSKVFLLTPANVAVTNDSNSSGGQSTFFNQS